MIIIIIIIVFSWPGDLCIRISHQYQSDKYEKESYEEIVELNLKCFHYLDNNDDDDNKNNMKSE